jgi:hypothetical protein
VADQPLPFPSLRRQKVAEQQGAVLLIARKRVLLDGAVGGRAAGRPLRPGGLVRVESAWVPHCHDCFRVSN